jgi:hypothetical protein
MSRRIHPDWCAQGAGCALGEHRAVPVAVMTLDATGAPVATGELTRIADPSGRELAEIRLRVALPSGDKAALRHLVAALAELHTVVNRLAASPHHPSDFD